MSHEIETNGTQAAFVSANTAAWHMLGETLDHNLTADEVMTHGHLGGWNVRKVPMFAQAEGTLVPVPNRHVVVRDNPFKPGQIDSLGPVGDVYHVIQNEEHTALLDALVDESGAHFETAGSLNGGKRVFVTMKLPDHISIGGVDPIDNYIAAINSHDGSTKFTIMVTPVRIVCANTLNLAFQDHSNAFTVRHTRGAQKTLVTEARRALDLTFNYLDAFQEEAERLINTTMTQTRFEEIIMEEFGPKEDGGQAANTRAEKKIDQMAELFSDAFTQEGVRETAWAGLNALTEWADHFSPVRGSDRDESRAVKAILDPSFKNRALQLMLQG